MPTPKLPEGPERTREMVLLLRLLESGQCPHSVSAAPIAARLVDARWLRLALRGRGWELVEDQRQEVHVRLSLLWPTCEQDAILLRGLDLNPWSVSSVEALPALRRQKQDAAYLHRKTWNAASAAGSKRRSRLPAQAVLTDDWIVRGRTNCEIRLVMAGSVSDWRRETLEKLEFTVSQRMWLQNQGLEGAGPSLIITIENVGAFVDLPIPSFAMLLHAPGSATVGAAQVVAALPGSRWVHFGDLDPAGMAACSRIARVSGRAPELYIPSFAQEYLDGAHALKGHWPKPPIEHPVLSRLVSTRKWLEQEAYLLDPRLLPELESLANSQPT